MKIYVISDSPEYAVTATNAINKAGHTAIMSETRSDDTRVLLNDLKANATSGFDMVLFLSQNAKDVALSANKLQGINAIACKDPEDAEEAVSDTRANVILVDSMKVSRKALTDILDAMLSGGNPAPKQPAPLPRQSQQAQQKEWQPRQPMKMPKISLGAGKVIGDVKKKGLKRSLKDTFGIED
ncbi:MAG: RpiB/LacA/LacB family sugar-phosphate isomerase [Candidatus Micrarchaeales archaeon]|nr:RpiB/LacA/LacB family sugar-phosphate isomerase [Candidatus Micrarchaeales archaeon]